MYSIKKIVLKNFGTHRETSLVINQGVSLVQGINETDNGQESNGSGKSFLMEAVLFALTGTSFRKVSATELITNGEKQSKVELTFGNSLENFVITRNIYEKRSSEVELIHNGENVVKTSVQEYNKYILDVVGLTKEDIVDYFFISKEKYTSFFSSSDSSKKELINRFSRANMIDPVIEQISQDIKDQESRVQKEKISFERASSSVESFQMALESLDVEKEKEAVDLRIKELEADLERIVQDLEQAESRLEDKAVEFENIIVPDLTVSLGKINDEIKSLTEQRKQSQEELTECRSLKNDLQGVVSELKKQLNDSIDCPNCKHNFSLQDEDYNREEVLTSVKETEEELEELSSIIKDSIQGIEKIDDLISVQKLLLNKTEYEVKSAKIKKQTAREELSAAERTVKLLNSKINEMVREIEKLSSRKFDHSQSKNMLDKIEEAKQTLERYKESLQSEELKLFDIKTYLNNTKRFKGYMANLSLSNIEGQTNKYLEAMKSNLTIKIEGYKELKTGEIREKIDVKVLRDGEETGSFGKLSGGEKARVEIATIFAINSIVNLTSGEKGLNLLILDEILESLDSQGIDSIIESLIDLGQNVFLITHGKTNSNRASKIEVVKRNGISELI